MARKKGKKGKKSAAPPVLIVQSKVREYVKSLGEYNLGADLFQAISDNVAWMLQDAAKRAEGNNRKTLQARDV